jgi:hypothetical protein
MTKSMEPSAWQRVRNQLYDNEQASFIEIFTQQGIKLESS